MILDSSKAFAQMKSVDTLRSPPANSPRSRQLPTSSSASSALNSSFNLVADRADRIDGLPGGVGQVPILVALAREERAGIATAHRHDDIGGLRRSRRSTASGARPVMSIPTSAMPATADGIDLVGGFRPAREGDAAVPGQVVEEAERHLRAPGVVSAQEQHCRLRHIGLFDSADSGWCGTTACRRSRGVRVERERPEPARSVRR